MYRYSNIIFMDYNKQWFVYRNNNIEDNPNDYLIIN